MIIFLLSTLGLLAFSQADLKDWGECKSTYIPQLEDNRTVCTYHMEVKDDFCMTFNGKDIVSDCEDQDGNTVECVACYSDDPNCAGTDRSIPFQNVTLSCGGVKRYVISVNGAEPGPPIRVKYGTIVNLTLHNNMEESNTTMHWHGMYQKGTPCSDGVPYITQYPTPPGSNYLYTFQAIPAGTFWYHSHGASQISDGMIGPLIVYEEDEPNKKYYDFSLNDILSEPLLPEFDQFIMTIADWNYEGGRSRFPIDATRNLRVSFSQSPPTCVLINGRGRCDQTNPQTRTPYFGYDVRENVKYRFRAIGAMSDHTYRISIDEHMLKVITSDGFDVEPEDFDYIIVSPGERYDFVLQTKQNPKFTEYLIRADELASDGSFKENNASVLRYNDISREFITDTLPSGRGRQCEENNSCQTLNCPFGQNVHPAYKLCKPIAEMNMSASDQASVEIPQHVTQEAQVFMNFVFAGLAVHPTAKPAINGKSFVYPTAPPVDPSSTSTECKPECDASNHYDYCNCTHNVKLYEKSYQLVFTDVGSGGSYQGMYHPIHIHGHSVFVTKIGFPENDEDGLITNNDLCCPCPDDEDQCCRQDDISVPCNEPRWKNDTWNEDPDSIPMNLINPPRKDTIVVPQGGYVIVRLKNDNPGWWVLHCHIERHLDLGMILYLTSEPHEQVCHQQPRDALNFYGLFLEQGRELKNVALDGAASVSAGSDAEYGNDDDPQTCATLDSEGKTWWKVDLGDTYEVYKVILQSDDLGLVNAVVRVGSKENVEMQYQCGEILTPGKLQKDSTTVDCIAPIIGRYVSIQSDHGNSVSLCEVVVMATASDDAGY
ncbi:uncharacterized protein [Ptychodera flava]|uniref:uncharacterized protein n=1 Tax=Ptychodera flava TaxID=63121 RepID=UPI003969F5D8